MSMQDCLWGFGIMFTVSVLYSHNIWAQSTYGFFNINSLLTLHPVNTSITFSINLTLKKTDDNTHHATQYSDWGHKHIVASQEHKIKWLTSSCQNRWENIPEIQPRRQRRVCGVSFIRHALCWEQRWEESVALAQSQQWDTWPENEWLLGLKMNRKPKTLLSCPCT